MWNIDRIVSDTEPTNTGSKNGLQQETRYIKIPNNPISIKFCKMEQQGNLFFDDRIGSGKQ